MHGPKLIFLMKMPLGAPQYSPGCISSESKAVNINAIRVFYAVRSSRMNVDNNRLTLYRQMKGNYLQLLVEFK